MPQQNVEGITTFWTDSTQKITKEMPVFYNPVMKLNRDLSLLALGSMEKQELRISLPMEASGVRAARILHELIMLDLLDAKLLAINDLSAHAITFAKKNVTENIGSFDENKVVFSQTEARKFLLDSAGFEYIDIDPFGTPNPFLDAAVQRIAREGIIAVTATDTSALAGTYPAATLRKYWAVPSRTWVMHDIGLRILIRKVQLIGAQYEKALIPLLSVATNHYYRVFFLYAKGNAVVKTVLKEHRYLHVCTRCMQLAVSSENVGCCKNCLLQVHVAGPLWTGPLHDKSFVQRMIAIAEKIDETSKNEENKSAEKKAKTAEKNTAKNQKTIGKNMKEAHTLLSIILDECKLNTVGFVDLHELASRIKQQAPKTETVLELLGANACKTHINGAGIKTDLEMKEFVERTFKKQ